MRIQRTTDGDEADQIGGEVGGVFILNVLNKIFITFILATTFAVAENDLDVNLPKAGSGKPESHESRELVINVLQDGRLKLGESYFEKDQLVEHLKQVALVDRETPITIRGDRDTPYQNAVNALDACGRANLHRISVAFLDEKN